MKLILAAALIAVSTPSFAGGSNGSPHALECMKKVGITHEGWVAHNAGTNEQVLRYIQCRDGLSKEQAHQKGRRDGNFGGGF